MEALQAILSRRSIRHFEDKPVPAEVVQNLLKAAMCAPSACDMQPWHFVVLTERAILDEIPKFHPHAAMLPEAKVAIVVCGEPDTSRHWQQDCAAAAENILLAAHAQGLGAVWLGVYPRDARVNGVRALLKLPEKEMPLCIVAAGYPAEQIPASERYSEAKVHRNGW
jgi:nitroreductase